MKRTITQQVRDDKAMGFKPCPECGNDEMEYSSATPAEPEVGVTAWRGGWTCSSCGHADENAQHDNDTL